VSKILALDIGFKSTGYTIWEYGEIIDAGIVKTHASRDKIPQSRDYSLRSASMSVDIADLIEDNGIELVVGEMPHGGAKSYRAGAMMCMANSIVSSVVAVLGIDYYWVRPVDVKIAVAGDKTAKKQQIMKLVINEYGEYRKDETRKYKIAKKEFSAGDFEHIADSIGAYEAAKNTEVVQHYQRRKSDERESK